MNGSKAGEMDEKTAVGILVPEIERAGKAACNLQDSFEGLIDRHGRKAFKWMDKAIDRAKVEKRYRIRLRKAIKLREMRYRNEEYDRHVAS